MKKNNFYSFSAMLLLASIVSVSAQEKTTVAKDQKKDSIRIGPKPVDRLGLKKEQQVPYREIIKRYAMLVGELRKSSLSKEEKMIKLKELETNKEAEISKVLSPEQFKIYQEMRQESKTKFIDMRKK